MEWSKTATCELIEQVRERRILWDQTDPDHKDRKKKHSAWAEVAYELNVNVQEVEKKMRNMIGQFQRELKKGKNGDDQYLTKWVYFEMLMFLRDRNEPKEDGSSRDMIYDYVETIPGPSQGLKRPLVDEYEDREPFPMIKVESNIIERQYHSDDGFLVYKKKFLIDDSSETFKAIVHASSHVDKSILMYKLFQNEQPVTNGKLQVRIQRPKVLITAPRGFGKSVNMDMMKCFLEIQHEAAVRNIPIEERSNYKLFKDLNIMAPEYRDFVKEHFGKYPVIKLNFLCRDNITSLKDIVDFCKSIVRDVFMEHEYLQKSEALSVFQREMCKTWCGMGCKNLNGKDVGEGLVLLCKCLCRHFNNTQIFMLIDEYDSPLSEALFSPKKNPDELYQIMKFYSGVLSLVLKGNDSVFGAVVGGISHIASVSLSDPMSTLTSYPFLDHERFSGYYGFTSEEVQKLCENFNLTEEQQYVLEQKYGGYQTKNGKQVLFNPSSIIKYLANIEKLPKGFWIDSGYTSFLQQAIKHDCYRKDMDVLVGGMCVTASVKQKMEKQDIEVLTALLSEERQISDIDVFLTYLLDQGYLSYAEGGSEEISVVKIPNNEVREAIMQKLRDYYVNKYNIDKRKAKDCSCSFRQLFLSITKDEREFLQTLQDVKTKLKDLFSNETFNKSTLQHFLFVLLSQTGFTYYSEISPSANVFLFNKKCAVFIQLKCAADRNAAKDALKEVSESMFIMLLNDKNYLPEGAEECIIMGISFNSETTCTSICCLRKQKKANLLTVEDIARAVLV